MFKRYCELVHKSDTPHRGLTIGGLSDLRARVQYYKQNVSVVLTLMLSKIAIFVHQV